MDFKLLSRLQVTDFLHNSELLFVLRFKMKQHDL